MDPRVRGDDGMSSSSGSGSIPYPADPSAQTDWIRGLRGARNVLDPRRAYASFVEAEPTAAGPAEDVATIFLTNKECPWTCLVCDLWTNTLEESVPPGAIPEQIREALARLPAATMVKLYNAGSFFDPAAIPPSDLDEIARLVGSFDRVIVECHPAFVASAPAFARKIPGRLEVAIGLETIHPEVLPRMNKRMSTESYAAAALQLREADIDVRTFLIVGLPWVDESEAVDWTVRSAAFAFEHGSTAVSLIPTRAGNGAMDALERRGEFRPVSLATIERAAESVLALAKGRVFVDLWELERFARCPACAGARRDRLGAMNLAQKVSPPWACDSCGGAW